MRIKICCIGLCLIPFLSFAQSDSVKHLPKRNTIYIEAFGQGLLNSISYDRLYRIKKKIKSSVSFGGTIMPSIGISDFYSGGQVSYNFLFEKKNHHLELGLGLNFLMDEVVYGVDYAGKSGI